jgi:hypothetical protein
MMAYSSVEHLAKTVLLSSWRGGVWAFMAVIEPSSAYFDESRINDRFPVVAGFWNPIDVWVICEEQLSRELRAKPEKLAAKKYVRNNSLKFAKVLSSFTLLPIYATVESDFFRDIWEAKGNGDRLFSSAYTQCSFSCCEMLDGRALQKGWKGPIKIVFDDGAEGKTYWDRGYRKYYASKPDSLLSKTPLFQDDKETLPILGADLYAWLLSRKYNAILEGEEAEALSLLHYRQPLAIELSKERMLRAMGLEEPMIDSGHDANAKGKTPQ